MYSCASLLTYAWCRSSYTALRSLNRLGVEVNLADSNSMGMGQESKLKNSFYKYTSFLDSPDNFIQDIGGILEKTNAKFLLPGHDETVALAKYRNMLPSDVILPVASFDQLEMANDKDRMADQAESLALSVPERIKWETIENLKSALFGKHGPWVVKLRKGNSAKGVFYPGSNQETIDLCKRLIDSYSLLPDRYPIVQLRVSGEGWGVSCLYWEGKRIASFTHRRLREKTQTGGTSTLRVSARNPILEDIAHKLLDAMNWHGLAMVEFKYSPKTKEGWFIEVNPRLWGSIHLAVSAGVDFPALLYITATQGPKAALNRLVPWTEGVVARWYLGDCIAAAGQLKQGNILSALKMIIPGSTDTYDDWFLDDPGAMIGQAAYYLRKFIKNRSLNPIEEGMLG